MKTDRIYIRISQQEKETFQQQAKKLGITLSEFIRKSCEEQVKKGLKNDREV